MPYKYEDTQDEDETWDNRGKKIWIQNTYTPTQAEEIIDKYTQTHNFNMAFNNKSNRLEYTTEDLVNLLQIIESNNTPSTNSSDVNLKQILIKKLTIYDLRTQLTTDTKEKMQWQKMFLDTVDTLHKLDKDIALKVKDKEIENKDSQIDKIMKKLQQLSKEDNKNK